MLFQLSLNAQTAWNAYVNAPANLTPEQFAKLADDCDATYEAYMEAIAQAV